MLQRLGIRGKILAVVAVPIAVLVLAAVFITASAAQTFSSAQNSEDLISTLGSARGLEADLQEERFLSSSFAHTVQDGQDKLDEAYSLTSTALSNLETALVGSDEGDGDQNEDAATDGDGTDSADTTTPVDGEAILADVNAAIQRTSSGYMEDARAVQITPPSEEGGWATFPSADDVEAMQASYADAVAKVDAISDTLPDDSNLNIPMAALSFRLNFESESATALFTEPQAYEPQLEDVWARVDAGVEGLLGSSERLASNEDNARAVEALLSGQEAVGNLPSTRAAVRATTVNVSALISGYSNLIGTIVDAADDVSVAMSDRDLVTSVQAYGDLDALIEDMRYEEVVIDRLVRTGSFLPGEAANARTMTARTDIALEDAQASSAAVPGAEPVPGFGASANVIDGTASSFQVVRTQVLTGLDASLVSERDSGWPSEVDTEVAAYEPLRDDMWTTVTDEAAADAQAALTQAVLTGLAAIAIVIVSIIIALVIARRIIGPLRRLTTTATAVEQELPRLVERVAIPGEDVDFTEVQIPVESRDEVGRLAEAFNGVNAATLSIAAEQAALRGSISEMFVNVARRDQVLLNRQLSSIDEMERTEDDPNTLTKLFALDHLATRMRRNSESLLVLAGIDTGRRLRRPMPLSDVIRTASSEIELYERIDLELDVDPEMLGHMALTAAHLFAELLENATVFSDPGTRVAVRTGETEQGYVVEIEDGGIGMTESEVAEANARVGSTAASEILGEQRLGLFVVGRIARRVGAQVEIRSQEGRGTLAVVSLPSSLFAGGAESPSPLPAAGSVSMAVDEGADDAVAGSPATVAEVSATAAEREIAAGPAYAPAALQAGESLAGRTGDLPARAGAPADEAPALPSRGGALPSRGESESIESLIAADAEAAPSAEATDPSALTDGTSQAGLPTRRRRSADVAAPEATPGITPVVGLPARATDAQLSALDAETDAGFTPSVAPAEVAPQSAEERASVFRGFRSRRETEQAASESLGQSARREGVALPSDNEGFGAAGATAPAFEIPGLVDDEPQAGVVSADAVETPPAIPGFADDDTVDPGEFAHEQEPGTSHGASAAGLAGASAFGAAAFFAARSQSAPEPARDAAAEPVLEHESEGADPHTEPAPATEPAVPTYALEPDEDTGTAGFRLPKFDPATTGQIPVIEDEIAQPAFTAPAEPTPVPALEEPQEAWTLPSLEQDEDVPSIDAVDPADAQDADVARAEDSGDLAPAPAEEDYPTPAWASVAGGATFGAAAVAAAGHGNEPADAEQERFAPVEPAGVDEVSLDDDVAPGHGAPPHAMPVEAAASAPSPQLDDLIQSAVEDDHRPGFFARLFGRGRKDGEAADRSAPALGTPEAPESNPVTPPTFAPVSSVPSAPSVPVAPTPTEGARFGAFVPEQETPRFDAPEAFAPQPVAWEAVAPAPEPPAEEATHAPSAEAAAWEAAMDGTAAAAASATPERASLFGDPVTQEEPPAAAQAAPAAFTPQSFAPEPEQAPEPAESWAPAGGYVPQATAFEPEPEEPAATPGEQHYTPEQLATAHGWEAAGASALQAAEPEQTTSYQPIIQPEPRDGDDMDYASAAFSELSSLASERPKIEKTRAGLQKRRASDAPPVEVKKLDEEVEVAPAQRDADAVRSRFSAFYSGTQRARQDAEEFDRATQIEENAGGQD